MNPFELTKDPDGGGMTVRVKSGYVVLTREEERRVTERMAGLMDENTKLRELCADLVRQIKLAEYFDCFGCKCEKWRECDGECVFVRRARELGIEVPHD